MTLFHNGATRRQTAFCFSYEIEYHESIERQLTTTAMMTAIGVAFVREIVIIILFQLIQEIDYSLINLHFYFLTDALIRWIWLSLLCVR